MTNKWFYKEKFKSYIDWYRSATVIKIIESGWLEKSTLYQKQLFQVNTNNNQECTYMWAFRAFVYIHSFVVEKSL